MMGTVDADRIPGLHVEQGRVWLTRDRYTGTGKEKWLTC